MKETDPVEQIRDLIEITLDQQDGKDLLISWLQGFKLPLVGVSDEPHVWLMRGLVEIPERANAERTLASWLALVLDSEPDVEPIGTLPDRMLYNLLMLCAELSSPDELSEPLLGMYRRMKLSGDFRGIDLRSALRSALATNQSTSELESVWTEMALGKPSDFLPGNAFNGFEALTLMPDSQKGEGYPAIDAIGTAIGYQVRSLATEENREVEFRTLVDRVIMLYPGVRRRLRQEFVRIALRDSWPEWCLEALEVSNPARLPSHRSTFSNEIEANSDKDTHSDNAVAIIGMSCRFPGGADSPAAFWSLLHRGVDAITEVPRSRWDIDRYYDEDPSQPGTIVTRCGGFLDRVDHFDAQLFHISPREATSMDPQQRILLECAWEALESAGISSDSLAETSTGVFVGISSHDYETLKLRSQHEPSADVYFGINNLNSVAAGRLSYFFGFRGPAMTIDTSWSSSLVAVHMTCRSLMAGDCDLALAAGVNLMLTPDRSIAFSNAHMLSPDGRCKTFNDDANGYVRSEGCGILVLKRLSQALADGDNILAVVRGSAVNNDGRSASLTAPNSQAQESVLGEALSAAGVSAQEVSYVEAHGTGTPLGDPVEVMALGKVYGEDRPQDQPLVIGSVKTNIGHTEAAAGMAGLIKVVLAMQYDYLPPHLHFRQPNPHMSLDEIPAIVPVRGMEWPRNRSGKPRLAGVSAFGISGTNAHVVLEEAPARARTGWEVDRAHLLVLSAANEEALRQLAERHRAHLQGRKDLPLADVCFTAATGRAHLDYRMSVAAASRIELTEGLRTFVAEENAPVATVVHGRAVRNNRIAFLFTGQGAQYPQMGRELYETEPVFRRVLERCDEVLNSYLVRPLISILYPPLGSMSPIHETANTQPALFALEVALAELWRSWGVTPDAVMGHSVGEYAAACVAGVMSLEDGLRLIAERGRLMQDLPQGEMAVLLTDEERATAACEAFDKEVSLAAVNGPNQVVISGSASAIEAILDTLNKEGIDSRRLNVSHAFHSPMMEPMRPAFETALKGTNLSPPTIRLVSNLTGEMAGANIATPQYWSRHVRGPIRFAAGLEALSREGCNVFLEIGPQPTLMILGRRLLGDKAAIWVPSLRPRGSVHGQLLCSLGQLYTAGAPIDWASFYRCRPGQRVALPTYPFQGQRYWIETGLEDECEKGRSETFENEYVHPLLGKSLESAVKAIHFESSIGVGTQPYLRDQRLFEAPILPTAAYLEMALVAGTAALAHGKSSIIDPSLAMGLVLEGVDLRRILFLPKKGALKVHTFVRPNDTGATFEIFSFPDDSDGSWALHAAGKLRLSAEPPRPTELSELRALPKGSVEDLYHRVEERRLDYGPAFRAVHELRVGEGEATGKIRLPKSMASHFSGYLLPLILLDACFQVLWSVLPESVRGETYLPMGVERLKLYRRPGLVVWSRVRLRGTPSGIPEVLTVDLDIIADDGDAVARIDGLSLKRADLRAVADQRQAATGLHKKDANLSVQLKDIPVDEAQVKLASWVCSHVAEVLGMDPSTLADMLDRSLSDLGMDSLTAIELRNSLQMSLNLTLPATLLFDYPTIHSLTGFLTRETLGIATAVDAAEVSPGTTGSPDRDTSDQRQAVGRFHDKEVDLGAQCKGMPVEEAQIELASWVCSLVAKVLGLDPSSVENIMEWSFVDQGMDSLLAVELRNRLQASLNVTLPATVVFDYPTIHSLTGFLAREVSGLATAADAAEASPGTTGNPDCERSESKEEDYLHNKLEDQQTY